MSTAEKKGRITSITIENFKGIGAPVTIPLREFTLLFGQNSIGKSTIIEALLLMNDWMKNLGPDLDTATLGGDAVHLGGFERFVHGHDLGRNVRIRVDFDFGDARLPRYPSAIVDSYLHEALCEEEEKEDDNRDLDAVDIHNLVEVQSCYFEIVAGRLPRTGRVCFLECNAGVNGENVISRKGIGFLPGHQTWSLNHAHQAVKGLKKINAMTRKILNYHADTQGIMLHVPSKSGIMNDFTTTVPRDWDESLHVKPVDDDADTEWKLHRIRAKSKVFKHEYRFISHFVSQILLGSGKLLSSLLSEQIFIGPLRQVPSRVLPAELGGQKKSWADGSMAWAELIAPRFVVNEAALRRSLEENDPLEQVKNKKAEMKRAFMEMARSLDISYQRMEWLGAGCPKKENYQRSIEMFNRDLHTIDFGYNIALKTTVKLSDDDEFMRAARALKEHPNSKESRDELLAAMKDDFDAEYEMVFVSRESGVELRPPELGIGVSQMLPILIGSRFPSNLFSIQQPELHLHPALQCQLADHLLVFSRLSGERKVTLMETHSEHLILRLLSYIRNTSKGDFDDSKDIQLTPNDISVLYVSKALDGVRVTQIRVDEQGQFIDEWPEGFFEEGFNEIVGGL